MNPQFCYIIRLVSSGSFEFHLGKPCSSLDFQCLFVTAYWYYYQILCSNATCYEVNSEIGKLCLGNCAIEIQS